MNSNMFLKVCIYAVIIGSIISLVIDPTPIKTSNDSSLSPYALSMKAFQPAANSGVSPSNVGHSITKIPALRSYPSANLAWSEGAAILFSNAFTKASFAIPGLEKILNIHLPPSVTKQVFYRLDQDLFSDCGLPYPNVLAYNVSEAASNHRVFTMPLYFQVVANTLIKFLRSENREIGHHIIPNYVDCVERAVDSADQESDDSLYKALLDGFVCFIKLNGFDFLEESDKLSLMFINELNAIHNTESL